jgi:hypothetical protein
MCIWLHTHTVTITDISSDLGELAEIPRQCVSVQITPLQYGQGCRIFQTALQNQLTPIFYLKSTHLKIFPFKKSHCQKSLFFWFRVRRQFFSDLLDLPLLHGLVKRNHISIRSHTCEPPTTHDDYNGDGVMNDDNNNVGDGARVTKLMMIAMAQQGMMMMTMEKAQGDTMMTRTMAMDDDDDDNNEGNDASLTTNDKGDNRNSKYGKDH